MRGTSDRSHPIVLNLILVRLILRTVRIQMIDSTPSVVWLGASDEDDGGGVKNGSCWRDDKASPWMLLMGEGGLWPSSVPLLLCWWDETTAICFPSYLPPSHPLTPSPWMQTLCCPFKQHARVVFHLPLEVTRYEGTTIKHRRTRKKEPLTSSVSLKPHLLHSQKRSFINVIFAV